MRLTVVILAAGKGNRMVSDLPKVLHELGGRPLLSHVLETAKALDAAEYLVVHGHGGNKVKEALGDESAVNWVEQVRQLGTGHAVSEVLPRVRSDGTVLILYGDVPLVCVETLRNLVKSAASGRLGLLTVKLPDPTGYGRVVRDTDGQVARIIEEKDATPEQRLIGEINTGILAAPAAHLGRWVKMLNNDNAQGEYYLTDVVEMAVEEGVFVEAFSAHDPEEVQGVNDRRQLANLERYYQHRQADRLLMNGATLLDPERIDVRGALTVGRDVVIDVNVIFEGTVHLGDGVRIGAHTVIRNSTIDTGATVFSHCNLDGVRLGKGAEIGPFARLRPNAIVQDNAKVGNFVEIKKAVIGEGSKVNHLTYVGDAEIGRKVNVGAGTITCNYDGANKHKTVIQDGAFIGSNVSLVAPVCVGKGATLGAGSVIGRDVPADSLALTRAPQKIKENWPRPAKKKH